MAFVKLDTGILDSTLWIERECREIFITALLMAEPRETVEPLAQLEVRSIKQTGFTVPPGWYGFVPAAGSGIARRAMLDIEVGLKALEDLGAPDQESRSDEFDGRRLVRVDGGYIVLNYMKYRERDYTTAERSRRYRERLKGNGQHAVSHRDVVPTRRDNTQAEAEAEGNRSKEKNTVGLKPDTKVLRKEAMQLLAFLNEKTGRNYHPVPANVDMIVARLRDGAKVEDLRAVVAKKCREWRSDPKMNEYLRPATLFNRLKFAQYQGELGVA